MLQDPFLPSQVCNQLRSRNRCKPMKSTTSVTKLIGKYSFRRVRYSFFIPHQYQHEHWTLPASCTADKLTTWRGREGKCPAVGASFEEERAQRSCVQGPEFLLLGSPVSQQVTHGVPSRSEQRHRLAGGTASKCPYSFPFMES